MSEDDKNSNVPPGLEHSWKWFEYHANQRMAMIRFYLIVDGAIGGGIGYVWKDQNFLLVCLLSSFGLIASYCFARLDYRVSHLLKYGEAALKFQQNELSDQTSNSDMEICTRADDNKTENGVRRFLYPYTYGECIRLLLGCAMICFSVMLLAGLWKAKM